MNHTSEISDIAVVGGGPAGMIAALALGKAGYSVRLFAPQGGADNRTSALMMPSIRMLEKLGVWPSVQHQSAPLEVMRLVDDTGRLVKAPTINFNARDIQDDPFGWNIPNALLVSEIRKILQDTENIHVCDHPVTEFSRCSTHWELHADAKIWQAGSVVAADGRKSIIRQAAGIETQWWQHPQTALTTILSHEKPHQMVSTEFHRPHGPFTLVPMPGNMSSLVWVEAPDEAERILALGRDRQMARILELSRGLLGRITDMSALHAFPLSSMRVSSYAAKGVFLVGETAHVFPPIGAQGLNLTMRDIGALVEVFQSGGINTTEAERAYNRARTVDVWARTYGVNLLNYSLLLPFGPVQLARSMGLGLLSAVQPLRNMAMQMGISPSNLPPLMRA